MTRPAALCAFALFLVATVATVASAQSADSTATFRRGNENAAASKWDDAIAEYAVLADAHVKSPALYWNWSQVASAKGLKGEALWAVLRADLSPTDGTTTRDAERLRAELGLDPSEVSLGFLGEARLMARRFRFDIVAGLAFLISVVSTVSIKVRSRVPMIAFGIGLLFVFPIFFSRWRDQRGVVLHKDAPLVDAARADAIALSNLREGEVVPILSVEGEYFRIQDASGARGFAHQSDVRPIGMN